MPADITVTEIFARIYGLYLLAAGIGLIADRALYTRAVAEFRDSPALVLLGGIAAFLIGAATVSLHNVWTGWPAILISLIGWIALIEGLLYIAARPLMTRLIARLSIPPSVATAIGIVVALIGLALLWAGFAGTA